MSLFPGGQLILASSVCIKRTKKVLLSQIELKYVRSILNQSGIAIEIFSL